MERKIGEVFNVHDTILQVYETKESDGCDGCFFEELHPRCLPYICAAKEREDGKNVQFKKISKTMITREQAKELLPIIQAFAEGKQIQDKIEGVTDWVDTDEINFEYEGQKIKHRIKPEPKYRPFETQEECWNEMLKHQPFGWVRSKKCKALLWNVTSINKDDITIICDYYKFHRAFECFEFTDGTPFGIKEE